MIYRVRYSSLIASYGPAFIEADSAQEARRKFAKGAFSQDEMVLITATPVDSETVRRALREYEGD